MPLPQNFLSGLNVAAILTAAFALALTASASRLNYESGWAQNLSAWKFQLGENDSASELGFNDSGWEQVYLPHTLFPEPRLYKKGQTFSRGVGWYRTTFSLGKDQKEKNLQLQFEGVSTRADLWLNGKYLGRHLGGFTPFAFDITEAVNWDHANLLAVKVDNRRMEVPPDGMTADFDYPIYGGIYRQVRIVGRAEIFVDDIYVATPEVSKSRALVKAVATVKNSGNSPAKFRLFLEVFPRTGTQKIAEQKSGDLVAGAGASTEFAQELVIDHPKLWSPDHPELYRIKISVIAADNTALDSSSISFGIRSIKFTTGQGFFLNNEPMK